MIDGRRALIALAAAIVLGATGFGLAIAQDQQQQDQSGNGGAEGELPVRRRAQLTPEQQVAEAAQIEEHGTNTSRRVMSMLDEARRERDIIRVTCLNDKLTQVNAHLRTLQSRQENLQEAVNTGDQDRRNHEYTVITVLGQHFHTLEQEANACLGQDIFETGTTRVVVDVDPSTPNENLLIQSSPDVFPPFIPPPASGSM